MAVLKGARGDTKDLVFELTKDETTIGRHGANMLVVSDPSISAFHCAIVKDCGKYTLRDLDSTNGTKVNGEPVKIRRLAAGDVLHVGHVELRLEGDDIETEEMDVPLAADPPPEAGVSAPRNLSDAHFKVVRRNTAKLVWITIGCIAIVSFLLVAMVIYKVSHLK